MKKLILLILIAFQTIASIGQIKKPNIIVILSDDHTQQAISAYGSRLMQTPNIDRIASEGALFNNSFVTNSICAPSRAVFLTGKYSHLNGLRDNSPKRNFNGSQQQVQKLLHEQQYQTAWIGKWHLQSYPQGFDFWKVLPEQGNYYQPDFVTMNHDTVRTTGYVTNVISDFSIDWLNKRDTSNPFFLVIGEKATHRNWMPAIEDLGSFDNQTFPMPENFWDDYTNRTAASLQDMTVNKTMVIKDDLKIGADYNLKGMFGRLSASEKQAYEKYYASIAKEYAQIKNDSIALIKWKYQRYLKDYLSTAKSLDRNIGRILHYLDSTKLDKNTIVIYTSDQGFYMGEHGWFDKRFMYEESLRTPLVMRYPGVIKPGTKINEMVINIDLAPTLLGFTNTSIPSDIQGKNIYTLFEKNPLIKPWRKSIYYHYYEYPQPHQVAPHFGVRTEKYKLIRFYGPHNDWELFDLTNDKSEMHNLISIKKYQPIILQLKKELKDLIIQFKDTEALTILESQQ